MHFANFSCYLPAVKRWKILIFTGTSHRSKLSTHTRMCVNGFCPFVYFSISFIWSNVDSTEDAVIKFVLLKKEHRHASLIATRKIQHHCVFFKCSANRRSQKRLSWQHFTSAAPATLSEESALISSMSSPF